MWRLSLFLFLLFAAIISGMLMWQWQGYSDQEQLAEEEIQLSQTITVEAKNNHLHVTQTIEGFEREKEYRVEVPKWIDEWECLYEDETKCESIDENPSSFLAKSEKMEVRYKFPVKDKQSNLIENWLPKFPDMKVNETSIEIIDIEKKDKTWVTGLPLMGYEEYDYINYYVFKGNREVPALYWQKNRLKENDTLELISIYAEKEIKMEDEPFLNNKYFDNFSHLSIVLTNSYDETFSNGILITSPNIKADQLERKVIHYYFQEKGNELSQEEQWLFDIFAALVLEIESEYKKGNELIEQLKNNFSEEELDQFLNNVVMEKELLTIQRLDELIGAMKDLDTSFFSLNKNRKTKTVPLYFIDQRKVNISDEDDLIQMIYLNEKRLFPFVETLEKLGLKVTVMEKEKSILVSDNKRSYRFYEEGSRFILNEEDYGLIENPIITINGKMYMEEKWLDSIFNISVKLQEDEIILSH